MYTDLKAPFFQRDFSSFISEQYVTSCEYTYTTLICNINSNGKTSKTASSRYPFIISYY